MRDTERRVADQPVDLDTDRECGAGLCRRGDGNIGQQCCRVTEDKTGQSGNGKAFRDWISERRGRRTVRQCPFGPGLHPRIARVLPITVPVRVWRDDEAEGQRLARCRRGAFSDQLNPAAVKLRRRGSLCGERQQEGEKGEKTANHVRISTLTLPETTTRRRSSRAKSRDTVSKVVCPSTSLGMSGSRDGVAEQRKGRGLRPGPLFIWSLRINASRTGSCGGPWLCRTSSAQRRGRRGSGTRRA